jgi:hypothetical protein
LIQEGIEVKRLVIVGTILALVAGMLGCGQPGASAVVFADSNLEAVIREAITIRISTSVGMT